MNFSFLFQCTFLQHLFYKQEKTNKQRIPFFFHSSFAFCFVDKKKEKQTNFYSILQPAFIMSSVIFNRTNSTLYPTPVNTTHRRLLYLPIRPAAKKLQILIDIFNHTLTKQPSSSSIISKIMGIDDDDL